MVSDTDSFLTARRLSVDEGILAGGSTGTASGRRCSSGPAAPRRRRRRPHPRFGTWLPLQALQRRVDGGPRFSAHERAHGRRSVGAQRCTSHGHDPRAPERDRPRGGRHHGRVRRLPDTGDPGRATARGGRGRRGGPEHDLMRTRGSRPRHPRPLGGRGHGTAPAVGGSRRDGGHRPSAPGGVAGGDRARQRPPGRGDHPVGRSTRSWPRPVRRGRGR